MGTVTWVEVADHTLPPVAQTYTEWAAAERAIWQSAELAPAQVPLRWRQAVVAGLMFAVAVAALSRTAPFLYFQF